MARPKKQNWSGSPPATDAEARLRLIEAALRCAQRKGLKRTTLSDIATEAGVTRPTVYTHFDDRHAVYQAAFTAAAARLVVGAQTAMAAKDTAAERAVESVLFFVVELPRDPCLQLILTGDGLSEFTSRALLDGDALSHALAVLSPVFELAPELAEVRAEVTEVTLRFALSLLTTPGPEERTTEQLRAFLHRRLLPAIGLAKPSESPC
ncbi:MAG: AcrR family transcriptional regulator [Bradymonadia bacterium]